MDVYSNYCCTSSSATRKQASQLRTSLQSQRQPHNDEYTKKPTISDLEARAIINKALLESLGVKFEKTELDDGFKRIDRVRNGQVVAFFILNAEDKKIQTVEQISENHIGSVTFYREDGETPFVKLENITPQENGKNYKVETTTLFTQDGTPRKTSRNNYMEIPDYNEFTPEFVDKIMFDV